MTETNIIGAVHVVVDTETGQEKIGDVQGGFDQMQLRDHIERYGADQLLQTLNYMQSQVYNERIRLFSDNRSTNVVSSAT